VSKKYEYGNTPLWGGEKRESAEVLEKPRPSVPDRTYEAYKNADRPHSLEIVRATQATRFPSYSYLLDVIYDRHLQSALTLVYTFMIVEIEGADLEAVAHSISDRKCERITEFDKKRYDAPASGDPIIKRIEVTAADEKLTEQRT
jgi:hypothetical protein